MKTLVDVRLLSRGGTSGIEEYTRNLLGAILRLDQENDYTLFYNALRKEPLNLAEPIAKYPNLKIVDWKVPNKILDFSSRTLGWPAIDKLIPADVVFSPHFNILKSAEAPRVITFHDLSFLHHPEFFSFKQRFWHWLQDYQRQAKSASKIIAVSEFTKSDLVNLLGIPDERIEVVYSGIDPGFQRLPKERLEIFQRERDLYYQFILYLGTIEPRKNVAAIIRAFNILKKRPGYSDFRLVLAGKLGWLYQDVLREIRNSPFKKDIVLWGPVRSGERVLLYNLARAFVYPSFFEGFGFQPLEAQASGCPVVVSDRTSLPEVVGESALKVNPWNLDEIAGAIDQAVGGSRERLIGLGLENIKRFSWEKSAQKTLDILKNAQKVSRHTPS
ncbi:MAG: group 1 glycosyl transferase [Parcubacteria group bacterium Gr01-1014_3]|nr:MAG: group 1 glycosyl transferase [Parcubacteria group bacterium Gr01-1014_3]